MELYGVEAADQQQAALLLEDLPTLGEVQMAEIGGMVSLQELTNAVRKMNSGRAPGVDGLPMGFYKHFWGHVGVDLHEELLECYKNGEMATSCRRGVLALLQKGIYIS